MIICKNCGGENDDGDDFCGNCGTFLEWVGERTAPEVPEEEPVHVAPPPKPGLIERVKEAIVGDGSHDEEAAAPAEPSAEAPASPPPVASPAASPAAPPRPVAAPPPPPPAPPATPVAEPISPEPAVPPPDLPAEPEAEPEAAAPADPTDRTDAPSASGEAGGEVPGGPAPDPHGVDGPPPLPLAAPAAPPSPPSAAPPAPAPPIVGPPPATAAAPAEPEPTKSERAPDAAAIQAAAKARAAALVAKAPPPSKSAATVEPKPEERKPGAPVKKRPVQAAPSVARIRPGDLICGKCGAGNDPERKFCRVDGYSLATAVQVKIPWWHRIFRPKKPRQAGERPDGRSADGGGGRRRRAPNTWALLRWIAALFALMAIVATLGPWANPFKDRWNSATGPLRRQFLPKYYQADIVQAISTTQVPGKEATNLIDENTATPWSPGGMGNNESVVLVLNEGTYLGKAIFTTGDLSTDTSWSKTPSVASVLVSYARPGQWPRECSVEGPECHLIELDKTSKPQTRDIGLKNKKIKGVRLTIIDHFGTPPGDVALAEVELKGIK